jgi:hypothetical protein
MSQPLPRSRSVLFASIAIALGLFGSLAALEIVSRLLPVPGWLRSPSVTHDDPYLRYLPNQDSVWSVGWDFQIVNRVHVNRQGFVNQQDYDPKARSPLLAVVGDSYVEALVVPYEDTLHGRLAKTVGARGRVYSFGIAGSPLSQYLAYAEHARSVYHPDGLAIVIVDNDFDESLLEYKSAPGFHYLRRQEDGSLELTLVPYHAHSSWLKSVARESALFRYLYPLGLYAPIAWIGGGDPAKGYLGRGRVPAQAHSARVEHSKQAVDFFLNELPRYAGLPVARIALLVDGMRPELYDRDQLSAAQATFFAAMRRYLIDQARRRGYATIDMQERFIARHACDGARFEWAIDGHWNRIAHEEAMLAILDSSLPSAVFGSLPQPNRACRSPASLRAP